MEGVEPENNTENNAQAAANAASGTQMPATARRSLDDPNATFEDLPFKPQLTEKQAKRANQTFKGMVLSIGFTIAILIPVLMLNPAPKDDAFESDVNLQATAEQTEKISGFEIFAPELGEKEYANFARWQANTAQGVPYWECGLVFENKDFVWVRQAAEANPTWIALITDAAVPTETRTIGGAQWEVRTKDQGTYLISEFKDSTVVLSSDTSDEQLNVVAEQVASELG